MLVGIIDHWYWYEWTPVGIVVGTAVLLASPYLALVAFMIVSLIAAAVRVWAIVAVPSMLGRAVRRRWQRPRTAAALSPAALGVRQVRSVRKGTAVLLANRSSERDMRHEHHHNQVAGEDLELDPAAAKALADQGFVEAAK